MLREVLEYLRPVSGTIVDACVGGGGHARSILQALATGAVPGGAGGDREGIGQVPASSSRDRSHEPASRPGSLIGIDCDAEALAAAKRQLGNFDNLELVQASYVDMAALARRLRLAPVTGVLFDFGASLRQLTCAERGFSFDSDGPIDMRFDQTSQEPTALDLVRRAPEKQLRQWLREYGEEPMSGRIARVVHERRHQLRTTRDLADAVRSVIPGRFLHRSLPRVFQALRIVTNREIENIRRGLAAALEILAPGGRLVALSYHSLEDREVKTFFRAGREAGRLRILTRKPLRPTDDEVAGNARSRSARLRAAEAQ
jgi:16S rRNA (cytosine1402-N4)-methyltransferase